MLYAPEFLAALPAAGPHERSPLINLNTHRPKVLQTFNTWFAELYPQGHADLEARLKDRSPSQFTGAFYELLVHRYLFNRGWTARRDYKINGGNPDFFVDEIQWPIEIAALGESEDEERDNRELDAICKKLDQIESPFWIGIMRFDFRNVLASNNPVVAWAKNQILGHNPHEEFEAKFIFEDGESFIDFIFSPKGSSEAVGNVGTKGMYAFDFEAVKGRMLMRLRKKAKKYDRDLLIFLCSGGGFWGVHEETLEECLFGDRVLIFDKKTKDTRERRAQNGFFTKLVTGEPQNRRVSAVVVCDRRLVNSQDDLGIEMVIFHNPYAGRRLEAALFPGVKQLSVASETAKEIEMSWINVSSGPMKLT